MLNFLFDLLAFASVIILLAIGVGSVYLTFKGDGVHLSREELLADDAEADKWHRSTP